MIKLMAINVECQMQRMKSIHCAFQSQNIKIIHISAVLYCSSAIGVASFNLDTIVCACLLRNHNLSFLEQRENYKINAVCK